MNKYKPHVTDGKVIGDSAFFTLANDTLGKECLDEAWQKRKEVVK